MVNQETPAQFATESTKDQPISQDSHSRSIVKAVSWRIIGTIDTMIWAWIITRKVNISLMIGSTEAISKIILFYFHERAWAKIPECGLTGVFVRFFSKKTVNRREACGSH